MPRTRRVAKRVPRAGKAVVADPLAAILNAAAANAKSAQVENWFRGLASDQADRTSSDEVPRIGRDREPC
jgi:hypothetical protein